MLKIPCASRSFVRVDRVICLTFLLIFFCGMNFDAAQAAGGQDPDVTVLIYHRFGEDKYPSTSVDVERFREQLAYLMANNYQVISLDQLVRSLIDKTALPGKSAVITVDDGYRSVYTEAWPILKSFGFPFTVFLYVKATERGYSDFLSWEQIREMKNAGVDFQDHSYSHERFGYLPKDMTKDQYRAWISADLVKSSRILMERLGERPRFFAIPYGEYNQIVIDEAKSLGYEAIFSQDPGSVSKDTDVYLIPREPILGENWSSMKHFEMVMNRGDLPLTEIKPAIQPLTTLPEIFGARVRYPERYYSKSYEIYVSEFGWLRPTLDKDVLQYENNKPLTRKLNRVIVKAQEKKGGRQAIRSWMLLQSE